MHLPDPSYSLPLVSKTDYLGVTLSYRAFDHDTVVRRVKAANICFRILRKWLLDQHHPLTIRLRLYNQCVLPTVSYGIHEMGISARSFQMITGLITKHHRTMARSPVHLTRKTNIAFYARMHIEPPWCYFVRQQTRLNDSLSRRRDTLILEAMQTGQQDICALTPAYPVNQLQHTPSASASFSQAPELKCPECDRAFHQAGPWKRHLRTAHQIPSHIEDLFDPLRDSYEGKATCRHCHKQLADIYRLRYHINARVCLLFDPHKETIVPIADRQSLRMHLRYKSIPGILLDKALVCEIAHHCVFCHLAVPARSIRKHYGERHQGLLVYEALHRDQVYGLANLGSGKGTCVLCAQQCKDVRTHQCGVLLQISILLGQTYDISHFPVMPTMMRPLQTNRPTSGSGTAATKAAPTDATLLPPQSDTQSTPMEVDADTDGIGHVDRSTPLFKCLACHTTFLTEKGLITHHQKHPKHAQMDRPLDQSTPVPQGSEPRPAKVTVKLMLASHPDGPCPEPARMYRCPLCQDYVGRKALISHLRKYHDVQKPDGFPFDPVHDMHRGHLACKHCHTQFTMEVALRIHFQRASCPVLLCNWTSHQHFGVPILPPENMDIEESNHAPDQVRLPWHLGLRRPEELHPWTPDIACSLVCQPLDPFSRALSFAPEAKLKWYHQTICMVSHHFDVPHSSLPQDPFFHFVAFLHELHPLTWAWHSSDCTPVTVPPTTLSEKLQDQLTDINQALHLFEHTLAQDWQLWGILNRYDGRRDVCRRSELYGSPRSMRTERWQTTTGCYGWNTETWQGSCSQILSILGLHFVWRQRRPSSYDCPPDSEAGGRYLTTPAGQELYVLHPMWQREHHANFVDPCQRMEPAQGEGRGQNAAEDAHVPAMLSAACTESSTFETRCKRRRLSSEPEIQRHLDRGQQMGLSHLGQSSHDAQTQSDATTDLGGNSSPIGTHSTSRPATWSDSQVLGLAASQAGHPASRCYDNHPMAFGPQSEVSRGIRTLPASSEACWKWNHTVDPPSRQGSKPPTLTSRQCHLPTVEEIVTGILETKLGGSGSTCYINSVLLAQTWSSLMSLTFNTAIWGAWEKQFLSMFVEHAGVVVDPCADQFLGRMLVDWFRDHPSRDQHDAGEFAGWFRQRLLEKTLPQYMQQGWSSRLLSSTEDQADVFAPVPMACPVEGFITLQQMINNWHHQEPFVHAFTCDSPWICIQVSRFPFLGQKSRCSVLWDRCLPVQIPIFRDRRGIHVEWHDFVVTAGVIHLGATPAEGHYRSILWHSGTVKSCDDFRSALPLGVDPEIASTIYLIWIIPKSCTSQQWKTPLPMKPKNFDELLNDRFA